MINAIRAFLWLEAQLMRQYRVGLILQGVQFLAFLLIFSRLPVQAGGSFLNGVPYVQFVLTGIVYQIFYESIVNGPTSRLSELQMTGQLTIVLSAPYPRWQILLAAGFSSALAGLLRALLVLLIGAALFDVQFDVSSWALLGLALVFISILSLAIGLINVAAALLAPRLNLTSFLSSILLGILSGVYIPIDNLPSLLRPLAWINPLRWGLDLFRAALGQHSDVTSKGVTFAIAAVIGLIAIAIYFYRYADNSLTRDNRYSNF